MDFSEGRRHDAAAAAAAIAAAAVRIIFYDHVIVYVDVYSYLICKV